MNVSRDGRADLARRSVLALALLTLFASMPPPALAQRAQDAPEAGTGREERAVATADRHMVSAANPYAVEAGLEMLRAGGSAVDAAIATQLVLNLVEPQSSGIGGGAFILAWDQPGRALLTYDGRETAPAAAKADRFLEGGKPMPYDRAIHSGLSVGVPGLVRVMEVAHKAHGKLAWAHLFAPAIRLAEEGFTVSRRLNLLLLWQGPANFDPVARDYFFPGGSAVAAGSTLSNPEFARSLRAIAQGGADAFYAGPIAAAIVATVDRAPNHAGDLTLADFAAYRVEQRTPLCFTYRVYRLCGMSPPSSGGLVVAQTLQLIEPLDVGKTPDDALRAAHMHLIAEAQKLAYADRERYVADPAFGEVPAGLLDRDYIAARRALIDPALAMSSPAPGEPPGLRKRAFGIDATEESNGTSHISVIDGAGNAVAMTTTIESAFGSRIMAAGFLLNNQLTDFSLRPVDTQGRPIANRVEGGKRPRSSMAPTIVFDARGEVFAVLGSPGGSRIPLYVVKALVALLDWRLDAQSAVALMNFGSRGETFEIEIGREALWKGLAMRAYGHRIAPDLLTSGTHVIVRRDGRLEGGADPRREGAARGD